MLYQLCEFLNYAVFFRFLILSNVIVYVLYIDRCRKIYVHIYYKII